MNLANNCNDPNQIVCFNLGGTKYGILSHACMQWIRINYNQSWEKKIGLDSFGMLQN